MWTLIQIYLKTQFFYPVWPSERFRLIGFEIYKINDVFLFITSDLPPSQKLPPHGYPLEHPFNKVCTLHLVLKFFCDNNWLYRFLYHKCWLLIDRDPMTSWSCSDSSRLTFMLSQQNFQKPKPLFMCVIVWVIWSLYLSTLTALSHCEL